MTRIVEASKFDQFPKTAQLLLGWLSFGLLRLKSNLAITHVLSDKPIDGAAAAENLAKWDGTFNSDPRELELYKECERREGWLVQGIWVFPNQDV